MRSATTDKKIVSAFKAIAEGKLDVKLSFTQKEKSENKNIIESIEKIISRLKNCTTPAENASKSARGKTTTVGKEKALETEIQKLKYYLDNIPSPFYVVDKQFSIQYINKIGSDILTMTQDECIGKKCYDLFKTPHCRTPKCATHQAVTEGKEFTAENVVDPTGINLPVQYTAIPLKNEKGDVIGAIEQITDITELKKTMDYLTLQQSYLNNLPAPVHIVDKNFTVEYINKNAAGVLGFSVEECIGEKCYDLFKTPHCRTAECRLRQAIAEDKTASGESVVDPKNINLPIQYTCIPIKNPKGEITGGLEHITDITELKKTMDEVSLQNWIQSGLGQLNEQMSGDQDIKTLSNNIISTLVKYLKATVGTFYTLNKETTTLELTGSYAFSKENSSEEVSIAIGEGLVGQVAEAKELISITDTPKGYLKIQSSLGGTTSGSILIVPFMFEGELLGVFEIGSFGRFTDKETNFLKSATESIGIAINSSAQKDKLKQLLEETQAQSEELQTQQEELRASNEELEEKNNVLQEAEEKLKAQQEELEASYEELEEKSNEFERQKAELDRKK
jgi:PAS domain S-box-containing protein